jgi:hypothetical protein
MPFLIVALNLFNSMMMECPTCGWYRQIVEIIANLGGTSLQIQAAITEMHFRLREKLMQ